MSHVIKTISVASLTILLNKFDGVENTPEVRAEIAKTLDQFLTPYYSYHEVEIPYDAGSNILTCSYCGISFNTSNPAEFDRLKNGVCPRRRI